MGSLFPAPFPLYPGRVTTAPSFSKKRDRPQQRLNFAFYFAEKVAIC
jgi:hypothetical protein